MKKIFVLALMLCLSSGLFGLTIKDLEVNETSEELKAKKSKFLRIKTSDLEQYEKIVRKIEHDKLTNLPENQDLVDLNSAFESYLARRLNMIRKVFALFRQEFTTIVTHVEGLPKNRLPAFKTLLNVMEKSLDESKLKGSSDKFEDLASKVRHLKGLIDKNLVQSYDDMLVLNSENIAKSVFLAKIQLLHRWLLEDKFLEAKLWTKRLEKVHPENPFYLALQSHLSLIEYKRFSPKDEFENILEKNLKNKFGNAVTVKVHGKSLLDKAFLYYIEALERGYPPENEIPGLLPTVWEKVTKKFDKIYRYWSYPASFPNYREYMKDMANHCKTIVKDVPFKKYASKAYRILEQIFKYWPSNAGSALIDYNEIMEFNRMVNSKKL